MTNTLTVLVQLIKQQMNLTNAQVFVFNQKIPLIKDPGIFVAVQLLSEKIIGSNSSFEWNGTNYVETKSINKSELIAIDIMSKDRTALDRYIEVVAALQGYHANEACLTNFMQLQILPNIHTISNGEGAAIPYRFEVTLRVMRVYIQTGIVPYYDHGFTPVTVITDPKTP